MMAELKGRFEPAQISKNNPAPACSEIVCIRKLAGLETENGILPISKSCWKLCSGSSFGAGELYGDFAVGDTSEF